MSILQNIVALGPEIWDSSRKQYQEWEAYLHQADTWLKQAPEEFNQVLGFAFAQLAIDPDPVVKSVKEGPTYVKWGKIKLDFTALLSPPTAQIEGPTEVFAFLLSKLTLLEEQLSGQVEDPERLKLAFEDIRKVVQVFQSIPADLDPLDFEKIATIKQEKLEELLPLVQGILKRWSGIQVSEQELAPLKATDRNIDDLLGIQQWPQELGPAIAEVRTLVPELMEPWKTVDLPGVNLTSITEKVDHALTYVEQKLPKAEQQFTDWQEKPPSPEAWPDTAATVLKELEQFLSDLPVSHPALSWLKTQLSQVEADQLEATVTELKVVFALPDVWPETPKDWIILIEQRLKLLLKWLSQLKLEGVDLGKWVSTWESKILGCFKMPVDGTDQLPNIIKTLLANGLTLAKEHGPQKTSAQQHDTRNNDAPNWLDQWEKLLLIWDFVEEQDIVIGMKEQRVPATIYAPPSPPPTSGPTLSSPPKGLKINAPSWSVHQENAVKNVTAQPSTTNSSKAHTGNQPVDQAKPTPGTTPANGTPNNPGFDWQKWLGNPQEGPISKLSPTDQQLIVQIFNGQYEAALWDELLAMIDLAQWQINLQKGWQSWTQEVFAGATTIGELFLTLLKWALELLTDFGKQIYQLLQKLMARLAQMVSACWALVKEIQLPEDHVLHGLINDLFNGWSKDQGPPNLILIFLALPVSVVKDLWEVSVGDVEDWINN